MIRKCKGVQTMQLKESGEMYLETIYVLSKKSNYIRSIDVCEEMGYSKPSVSRAVGLLKEGGYLKVGDDGSLILTDLGREIAEKTYERHTVLSKLFVLLGDPIEITVRNYELSLRKADAEMIEVE
jgi:DtxR family transcriptional regulator, Mn-dependent transcriptional regulator